MEREIEDQEERRIESASLSDIGDVASMYLSFNYIHDLVFSYYLYCNLVIPSTSNHNSQVRRE